MIFEQEELDTADMDSVLMITSSKHLLRQRRSPEVKISDWTQNNVLPMEVRNYMIKDAMSIIMIPVESLLYMKKRLKC